MPIQFIPLNNDFGIPGTKKGQIWGKIHILGKNKKHDNIFVNIFRLMLFFARFFLSKNIEIGPYFFTAKSFSHSEPQIKYIDFSVTSSRVVILSVLLNLGTWKTLQA